MNSYQTIKETSLFELKDRGSKFIGIAIPIESKNQVKIELQRIKETYPKGNHYCFAYQVLEDHEPYYISNDDGEPNNSAGMPILGQIRSFELNFVLVVVIRYFGGTKLGIGGLISAYKGASEGALNNAEIIIKKPQKILNFKTDYQTLGSVLAILDKNQISYEVKHQNQMAFFQVKCNLEDEEKVKALFGPLEIKID